MASSPISQVFHFVRCAYDEAQGIAELVYAFDDSVELIEKVFFPAAPKLNPARRDALSAALRLLHGIAGVSYYKAVLSKRMRFGEVPSARLVALLDDVYRQGLGEFAYRNEIKLADHLHFPEGADNPAPVDAVGLPRASLVPIGGGKDSLVTIETLRQMDEPQTLVWVGNSPLIAACAAQTGLSTLNIRRELAPQLFEMTRAGAPNGHIPITAINSAILTMAALIYGFDSIVFSNERSASAATLQTEGGAVNHQWSKSLAFEEAFADYVRHEVAADLAYFSLLRPYSELAITRQFAKLTKYHTHFSSCNRNFSVLGKKPEGRWCGVCPKCHFVFLALAPFMTKDRLVEIFGRNLLDDSTLIPAFDALIEWQAHKPFECVGEAQESRAALYALSQDPQWQDSVTVQRFACDILPQIDRKSLVMTPLLAAAPEGHIPPRLADIFEIFAV